MAWTAPRTWVSGETVTAALMNTHLRDNQKAFADSWTAFTPTWSCPLSTQPSIGNGTLEGRYATAGRTVFAHYNFVMGSTTTKGSGSWQFGFPFTSATMVASQTALCGWIYGEDLAAVGYAFYPRYLDTSNFELTFAVAASNGVINNTTVQSATPFTWATGDYFRGILIYQRATS